MFSAEELEAAVAARGKKRTSKGFSGKDESEVVSYSHACDDEHDADTVTDSDDDEKAPNNCESHDTETEPIIEANWRMNIQMIPMERSRSTRTDATRTDGSEFYTPLETVASPIHHDDDGDSTATISTTGSFPQMSPSTLEMDKIQQMMEVISVKLTEHINTTDGDGPKPPSAATASLSHRRRRKTRSLTQSRAPSRGSLTPPVNMLPRCHSFAMEEYTSMASPIRHLVPSESFRLASAGKNAEDFFWNKLHREDASHHHIVTSSTELISPSASATETNQRDLEKTIDEASSAGLALDAALMQASALPDLDLTGVSTDATNDVADSAHNVLPKLRWMQLLARWRHEQMAAAMLSWPTLSHFCRKKGDSDVSKLRGDNISGFPTAITADDDIPLLSPYLAELGPIPCCCTEDAGDILITNQDNNTVDENDLCGVKKNRQHRWDWQQDGDRIFIQDIRHELWGDRSRDEANFTRDLSDLISTSEECLPEFESFLRSISDFAIQNPSCTPWAACVKSRDSVLAKASIKYKGDVTLVKDILRGSIICPDDSSLVCALLALYKMSREESFSVVRLKNLFRASHFGTLVPTNLPTGYRHVLVNIRLNNGLLAEIQFHLVQMYDLMGPSGYKLHQDLMGCPTSDYCDRTIHKLPSTESCSLKIFHPFPGHTDGLRLCSCTDLPSTMPLNSNIVDCMISHASCELRDNKWDLGSHICLSKLLQTRFLSQENVSDKTAAISLLDRALEIADRACSIGMIGWEAYGISSPLDRVAERPIDILSIHAGFLAQCGDWDASSGVCMTLLVKCERRFPLYHPLTIAALLDVASSLSCSSKNADRHVRKRIVGLMERANYRVSAYLKEQMRLCPNNAKQKTTDEIGGANNIYVEEPNPVVTSGIKYLRGFVSKMLILLKRPMVRALGSIHPTTLFFHCYIADSVAILASYSPFGDKDVIDQCHEYTSPSRRSSLWSMAGEHYRVALKGWIKLYGRGVSYVPATACGLARCLWELGKGHEAFVLLSRVIGFNGQTVVRPATPSRVRKEGCETIENDTNLCIAHFDMAYEEALAFSLWWMSVYFSRSFTKHHPADARLRAQILNLLGASAEHLLIALTQIPNNDAASGYNDAKLKCEAVLRVVEDEAARVASVELGRE